MNSCFIDSIAFEKDERALDELLPQPSVSFPASWAQLLFLPFFRYFDQFLWLDSRSSIDAGGCTVREKFPAATKCSFVHLVQRRPHLQVDDTHLTSM